MLENDNNQKHQEIPPSSKSDISTNKSDSESKDIKDQKVLNDQEKNLEEEDDYIEFSENEVCHRIIPKGSNIDLDHLYYYKCYKLKERGSFLSAIGIKSPKIEQVNYIVFFDEIYMYLAKDIEYDKSKPNIRRCGNKYNLFYFINATFNKIENSDLYKLVLEIIHENNPELLFEKEYYFTNEFAGDFFEDLQEHLFRLGIMQPQKNDNQNILNNANLQEEEDDVKKEEENKLEINTNKENETKKEEENKLEINTNKEIKGDDIKEDKKVDIKEEIKEDVKEEVDEEKIVEKVENKEEAKPNQDNNVNEDKNKESHNEAKKDDDDDNDDELLDEINKNLEDD